MISTKTSVLAVLAFLTVAMALGLGSWYQEKKEEIALTESKNFLLAYNDSYSKIGKQASRQMSVLKAITSFFKASNEVSLQEFQTFVSNLDNPQYKILNYCWFDKKGGLKALINSDNAGNYCDQANLLETSTITVGNTPRIILSQRVSSKLGETEYVSIIFNFSIFAGDRNPLINSEYLFINDKSKMDPTIFSMDSLGRLSLAQVDSLNFKEFKNRLIESLDGMGIYYLASKSEATSSDSRSLQYLLYLIVFIYAAAAALILTLLQSRENVESEVKKKTSQLEREIDKRRESQLSAEKNAKIKTEFLANMSHEIRTPLNSIIGMSELLCESLPMGESYNMSKIVRSSSEFLLQIVNNILDVTKMESGRLQLELSEFSFDELCHEVKNLFNNEALRHSIVLNIQTESELGSLRLRGDPIRIKQILINFIGNAIKFTPPGGLINVLVRENKIFGKKGNFHLMVSDSGIGIPNDKLDTVFDKFSQVENLAQKQYAGTGIGLNIAKRIAEAMGGDIWVDSKEGVGSTFHVSLNIKPLLETKDSVELSAMAQTTDSLKKALQNKLSDERLKILLVDDAENNRLLIKAYFKGLNLEVIEADNGKMAVDLYQGQTFGLVLMDMQMPVMDGMTATKLIREYENSNSLTPCPIIALTAFVQIAEVEQCLSAGCNIHLGKPLKRNALLRAVLKMISYENEPEPTRKAS